MTTMPNRPSRVLQIAAALFSLVDFAGSAQADIYQWEYINPAEPSQGKQQSTTLAPAGAGVDAFPGADLAGRNLTKAYLVSANLSTFYPYDGHCFPCPLPKISNLSGTNLTNADLSSANLDSANLYGANLHGTNLTNADVGFAALIDVDFSGAEVHGADFSRGPYNGTGMSLAQLYSTTSYQSRDLTGIDLSFNQLVVGNFVGQNLTDASFFGATLTDADFAGAEVRGANFAKYSSYAGGITLAQLYSTASYEAHDLSGIGLGGNDVASANFAGQNRTNAYLSAIPWTEADLTAADARGAFGLEYIHYSRATIVNLILPDGHIDGLELDTGCLLVVREYHGPTWNPALVIPITVDQHLTMGPGGTLRMVFEADAWDSTISFAPGIPVALGGTLELTFATDVNLASQVGRTFDLFDWTGVNPTGTFNVTSPYAWELSNLYTTGEITLTAVPEPGSFALAPVSAFSLTLYRRRKIS